MAVRREAIRCLVECGDAKDSKALWQALEDVDSGVRTAASAALARLGGDPVLPHLERAKSVDGATLRPVLRVVLSGADGRLLSSAEQRQAALPVYLEQRKSRRWLVAPRRLVGNPGRDPARLQPWVGWAARPRKPHCKTSWITRARITPSEPSRSKACGGWNGR